MPIFIDGMNLSANHSSYCKNVEEELGKVLIREETDEMEEIINRFNELNEELLKKEYKEKAEEIFKSIPMKMEKFYERFDAECMNIPIFKYYDPYQAFQRISCASNEDIVAIKEKIIDRANNNPEITKIEALNLKMLGQIINDYVKGKETTIKTVLLREFAKELNEIVKK